MVRWICSVRPDDRIFTVELKTRLKLKSMRERLQDRRLQWFEHIERIEESVWFSKCRTEMLVVASSEDDQRKYGMR